MILAIKELAPVRLNAMMVNGISRLQSAKVRNVFFSQLHAFTCIRDDLTNVLFMINQAFAQHREIHRTENCIRRCSQNVSLTEMKQNSFATAVMT